MEETELYKISYKDMKKIIKNYYMEHGRNVNVIINNEIDSDRFAGTVVTTIQLSEKITLAGVETSFKKYLSMDDLKKIINDSIENENKELVDLNDNAYVESRCEGYGMDEHDIKYITGKSFTLIVKEKKNNKELTMQLK